MVNTALRGTTLTLPGSKAIWPAFATWPSIMRVSSRAKLMMRAAA